MTATETRDGRLETLYEEWERATHEGVKTGLFSGDAGRALHLYELEVRQWLSLLGYWRS